MFWIEESEDTLSFVVFSQCSIKEYDEFNKIGGVYFGSVSCVKTSQPREGWVFNKEHRSAVDAFIERETCDLQSVSEASISLDNIYDLLVELFSRVEQLERKVN